MGAAVLGDVCPWLLRSNHFHLKYIIISSFLFFCVYSVHFPIWPETGRRTYFITMQICLSEEENVDQRKSIAFQSPCCMLDLFAFSLDICLSHSEISCFYWPRYPRRVRASCSVKRPAEEAAHFSPRQTQQYQQPEIPSWYAWRQRCGFLSAFLSVAKHRVIATHCSSQLSYWKEVTGLKPACSMFFFIIILYWSGLDVVTLHPPCCHSVLQKNQVGVISIRQPLN